MENFNLYLPTKIFFGKDRLTELPNILKSFGNRILIAYGGGSIKKIGLFDKIKNLLKDFEIVELSGIEPNPKISSVREGVSLCKTNNIDVILSIGGGSVLDCVKNIAAGAYYDGDPWDLVINSSKVTKTLPIVDIITLAATGSEYDCGGVITNTETKEKRCIENPKLYPIASFCDPTLTYTVPQKQTAAAAADIMSHTFEQYLVKDGNILSDAICEGMLKTVIEKTPIAMKDPNNYDARSQLLMASSFGCNGLLSIGRTPSTWPCHAIEHELSAFYDITHGVGLAIITPHWMTYSLSEKTAYRFAQYGERVFNLSHNEDDLVTAKEAIRLTSEFFKSLGLPAKLREVGVTDEYFEQMADHIPTCWHDLKNSITPIDKEGIIAILKNSL